MNKFNDKQLEIINNLEGIFVVDAGAGTGKTTTMINRYLKIIENDLEKEVLLVTFTNNAASDMKRKVLELAPKNKENYNIMTFHAFCNNILKENSLKISKILEIDDILLNYDIIDNKTVEEDLFLDFLNTIKKKTKIEFLEILDTVDELDILYVLKKIASCGIIPKTESWFMNRSISGNKEQFIDILIKKNQTDSPKKHSQVRKDINSLKQQLYNFNIEELLDHKTVKEDKIIELFDNYNIHLNEFIHYIYREYIKYLVSNNLLNFDFLMMFTFVLLYNNKDIRDKNKFNYIIIDEFQDTNDLQFMIALLLMKKKNLMVVGDWKQSIYGFRNANVENIIKFSKKIELFSRQMNEETIRTPLIRSSDIKPLILNENYRSSKEILDLAHNVIKNHELESYELVKLKDTKNYQSKIFAYELKNLENEYKQIVNIVIDLINNKKLDSLKREIKLSDICVLTRTKNNARELQKVLLENSIPSIFEGGANVYRSDLSVLLLNYLKLIYNSNDKNALISLLEYQGKDLDEINNLLKMPLSIELSNNLYQLRKASVSHIITFLIDKYKINDIYSNTFLINILNKEMDTFDLIKYIESNIKKEENTSLIMHNNDAVTIQTIHSSKGLEYPVVIIANINQRIFPSVNSINNTISYDEILGVRLKKEIIKKPRYYIYDNPITKILNKVIKNNIKEEELRLFYVAITRSKEYLYFTSSNPSIFFDYIKENIHPITCLDDLNINKIEISPNKKKILKDDYIQLESNNKIKSTHDEINLENYTYQSSLFGNLFHEFSDSYIKSRGTIEGKLKKIHNKLILLDKNNKDIIDNYMKFISNYDFKYLKSEKKIVYKKGDNILNGIIDIYYEDDSKIEIIDLKSDKNHKNIDNYKMQLKIYKNSVEDLLKNNQKVKKVITSIYWLRTNKKDILNLL